MMPGKFWDLYVKETKGFPKKEQGSLGFPEFFIYGYSIL